MPNSIIKVLVVDDSELMFNLISDILQEDNSFCVVGHAKNGKEGIEKTLELSPDLITMDIDMPVMNGLDAVSEIMKQKPTPIVVITTRETAYNAYEATKRGAMEFFSKSQINIAISNQERKMFIITLKNIAKWGLKKVSQKRMTQRKQEIGKYKEHEFSVLVIGASTGGPRALLQVLPLFSSDFTLPIVLVQHNHSGFDDSFNDWLRNHCNMKVKIAENMDILKPGTIYIAPTDNHLKFYRNRLLLSDEFPVHNQKPSIDVAFKSAADVYKDKVIAVILTGMGKDGALGIAEISENGGFTIAQNEETSLIFSMPKAAIETGKVHEVLPVNEISKYILNLLKKNGQ